MKSHCKKALVACAIAGIATFGTEASAQKGMTWTLKKVYQQSNPPSTVSGHNVIPDYVTIGADNATNAYQGDTDTSKKLRIVCIKKVGAPQPANYPKPGDFYYAWSGGIVGLTPLVAGTSVKDRAQANAICAKHVGAGFRVAEHHDNGVGGWRLGAHVLKGHLQRMKSPHTRFWASIKNQNSNFWQGGHW